MATYNYADLVFPTVSSFEPMFRIIKKYNLAQKNKDYVSYYKLTFKSNLNTSTPTQTYMFNESDTILYVKKKEGGVPTNPPKIFGLYDDVVYEDGEINNIRNSRTITDKSVISQILECCEMTEITPPESKANKRALNERYKNDLINSIIYISFHYGINQEVMDIKNNILIRSYLSSSQTLFEYENILNQIKIYPTDKFQIETDAVLRKKLNELKHYYMTDFEVFKQLEFIANTAKREGILNEIRITKDDLEKNNIKIIPDAHNSLDSFIEQTTELLELYKNKYEIASEAKKKSQDNIKNLESNSDVATLENLPDEIKKLNQFVIWKNYKNGKVVFNPYTGWFGSTNEEMCWCDLNTALIAKDTFKADGIGIVLSKGLMGIDINNIYDENNNLLPFAKSLIDDLNSYTEYSPSKKGVHILVYANQPTERSKFGKNIRWFSNDHFFALTGIPFEKTKKEISQAQPIIDRYYSKFMQDRQNGYAEIYPEDKWNFSITNMPLISNIKLTGLTTNKNEKNDYGFNDEDLMIELRMKEESIDYYYPTKTDLKNYQDLLVNGKFDEFRGLWRIKNNLWSSHYENEISSWDNAVLDFLKMVRIFSNDKNQMDRIFRSSYLMSFKFDELKGEKTYGQALIEQILMRFKSPYDDKR